MEQLNPKYCGMVVEDLWRVVEGATGNLGSVPGLVKKIIEKEVWRRREYRHKIYEHTSFLSFITTKPLSGCGWPPEKVEALIKDDPVVLPMWRQAITGAKHVHADADIISIKPKHGTSRGYTLARLKRERPDLYERVVGKELSAHAAALEAGFRKNPTPFQIVMRLLPRLTEEEWRAIVEARP